MAAIFHVAPLAAPRADHPAAATQPAHQIAAKEIAAAPLGPVHPAVFLKVSARPFPARFHTPPQLLRDDAPLRNFHSPPGGLRSRPTHLAPGFRVPVFAGATPNRNPTIPFIPRHLV